MQGQKLDVSHETSVEVSMQLHNNMEVNFSFIKNRYNGIENKTCNAYRKIYGKRTRS